MYEIRGDIDEIRELTKGIKAAEPALMRAAVSAINKTATSVRGFAVKLINKDYNVKQKAIRAELHIKRANFKKRTARIIGESSPGISLYKFSPTPKRIPSTIHKPGRWMIKLRGMVPGSDRYLPKGGIKVMVTRGKRKMVEGAFIARMSSGHVGIFRRADNNRVGLRSRKTVIEELYGPSPIRLLDQDRYQIPLDDHAGDEMDKNMAREANYYLKKYKVLPDA